MLKKKTKRIKEMHLKIKEIYFISKYFLSRASKLLWFANHFFRILLSHGYQVCGFIAGDLNALIAFPAAPNVEAGENCRVPATVTTGGETPQERLHPESCLSLSSRRLFRKQVFLWALAAHGL